MKIESEIWDISKLKYFMCFRQVGERKKKHHYKFEKTMYR